MASSCKLETLPLLRDDEHDHEFLNPTAEQLRDGKVLGAIPKLLWTFCRFAARRIVDVVRRPGENDRRMAVLDGLRAIVFLWIHWTHARIILDNASKPWGLVGENRFPPGNLNYAHIVLAVLSGFLSTFTLFLRSGPIFQSVVEKDGLFRLQAFGVLFTNTTAGRILRLYPVLASSMVFTYFSARVDTVGVARVDITEPCQGVLPWISSLTLLGNLSRGSCFGDLWTIPLLFQLYVCVAPLAVFCFHRNRTSGYLSAWLMLLVSVGLRAAIKSSTILGDNEKMPWNHFGEFAVGALVCMSFIDRFGIIAMKSTKDNTHRSKPASSTLAEMDKLSAADKVLPTFMEESNESFTTSIIQRMCSAMKGCGGERSGADCACGGRSFSVNAEDDGSGAEEPHFLDLFAGIAPRGTSSRRLAPCGMCGSFVEQQKNLQGRSSGEGGFAWPRALYPRPILRTLLILGAGVLLVAQNDSAWSKHLKGFVTYRHPWLLAPFLATANIIFALGIGVLIRWLLFAGRRLPTTGESKESHTNEPRYTWLYTIICDGRWALLERLRCILSSHFFHVLAKLSYCGFCMSMLSITSAISVFPSALENSDEGKWPSFLKIYFSSLALDIFFAFLLMLLVEQPATDVRHYIGCARKTTRGPSSTHHNQGGIILTYHRRPELQ